MDNEEQIDEIWRKLQITHKQIQSDLLRLSPAKHVEWLETLDNFILEFAIDLSTFADTSTGIPPRKRRESKYTSTYVFSDAIRHVLKNNHEPMTCVELAEAVFQIRPSPLNRHTYTRRITTSLFFIWKAGELDRTGPSKHYRYCLKPHLRVF